MANFATGFPVTLNAAAEARCTGGRPRPHDPWRVEIPHEPHGSRKVTISAALSRPWGRVSVQVDMFDDLEHDAWWRSLLMAFGHEVPE